MVTDLSTFIYQIFQTNRVNVSQLSKKQKWFSNISIEFFYKTVFDKTNTACQIIKIRVQNGFGLLFKWLDRWSRLDRGIYRRNVNDLNKIKSKLYIPSTLNIDLILWNTQLIVCAENVKSWVFPFTFQAYILPHTLNCMCASLFQFHIWFLELF